MEKTNRTRTLLSWTKETLQWVSDTHIVGNFEEVWYSIGGFSETDWYMKLYLCRHIREESFLIEENIICASDAKRYAEDDLAKLISKYAVASRETESSEKELRWIIRSCERRSGHVFVEGEYGPHKFTASLPAKQGEIVLATLTHEFKSEGTDLTQALKNALDQAKDVYDA